MKIKIISILFCFVFVLVAFSGCGNTVPSDNDDATTKKSSFFSDLFNKTPTNSSDESATNGGSSEGGKVNGNTGDSNEKTSDKANQNSGEKEETNTSTVTRDSRLVGVWNASTEIPINENGATVTSNCTVVFNEDGTFTQTTTEAQARQMIIDTYLIVFNCRNEQELDAYIRINKGTTLEGYVVMALAEMTDEDFYIKGTWETKSDNTLYETTLDGDKKHIETATYVLSNDGTAVKLSFDDGAGGAISMILKKA